LTHILVASGTQVSLLILLLAILFCRVYADFTWRSMLLNAGQFGLTLAIVLAYAALTGFETSIARALAMGTLVLVGRLFHREADGLTSLAQSGLILLVLNPLALSSSGFLLSFGATLGLIYAAGVVFPLAAPWGRLPRHAAQTLATTGGAQLFVAPVLAYSFQQLSLWGLLSNLVAIPTSFALLIAGGVCSLGLSAVPVIGVMGSWIVYGLCFALDWEARLFAALPGSNLAVPQPTWWWIAAYYTLLLLAGERAKSKGEPPSWLSKGFAIGAVALPLLLITGVLKWQLIPQPELSALALPNCEAYLWRPYNGSTYLIARAAGLERSHNADTVSSAIRFRGVNRLRGVIWLDAPPEAYPFPDYPSTSIVAGGALPQCCDMAWLTTSATVAGARFGLGKSEVWLYWSDPSSDSTQADFTGGGPGAIPQPALVLAGPGVSPAGLALLEQDSAGYIATGLRHKAKGSALPAAVQSEVRVLPRGDGLKLATYRPEFPE
jgi:ComEC/Rec2-related protein